MNSFSHVYLIFLSTYSKDAEVKGLSSFYHIKYTAQEKKKIADLLINCCQYKSTEMQFNSASNGWRLLGIFHCWESRIEEDSDGADHSGTNNLN